MAFSSSVWILSLYMSSGIALTIYNRWLLADQDYGFHFPVTLIMIHMIMNAIFAAGISMLFLKPTLEKSPYWFAKISLNTYIKSFVPIGLLFGADITLTSLALEHSSVSFVEIVRSSTPACLLIYEIISGKEQASIKKIACILLLCAGILLTSLGEINFSMIGFQAALGSSLASVTKLILLEILLVDGGMNHASAYQPYNRIDGPHGQRQVENQRIHPILSMLYFAPVAAIVLICTFFFTDLQKLEMSKFIENTHTLDKTILYILFGSLLACGLNSSELFIIQNSSALSLCVAGVAKLILLVIISSIAFGKELTFENQAGFIICICGVSFYNYIKFHEQAMRGGGSGSHTLRYTELIVDDFDLGDVDGDEDDIMNTEMELVDFLEE